MTQHEESLLGRVAASIAGSSRSTPSGRTGKSILSQAAEAYGRKPRGAESTIPTGFDPQAASLFEAVIEAAFLVANADGEFDDTERQIFETVVAQACQNSVQRGEVSALVSDLSDQLDEDGVARRIDMVAGSLASGEHRVEVLRIAALMAHVSGGVKPTEQRLMEQLASSFGLSQNDVSGALFQAADALDG